MGCSSISVRALAAVAAVCALFGIAAAAARAAPLVWTTNATGESVSTVDSATGRIVGSAISVRPPGPIGSRPGSIAITLQRGRLGRPGRLDRFVELGLR